MCGGNRRCYAAVGAPGQTAVTLRGNSDCPRLSRGINGPPTQGKDAVPEFAKDVVIVGGCGHVGLPLGLALADVGASVVLYDRAATAVDQVRAGKMPFVEDGADELLERMLATGRLDASDDPTVVAGAEHVVVVVGTPVDEHLNPDPKFVLRAVEEILEQLRDGQVLILRSTVYPGVTAMVEKSLSQAGKAIDVAFCPERIAEGKALVELRELPQIVSGKTDVAVARAEKLFGRLTDSIVHLDVEEAELAKLFTNTWRYIKFAAANQLYMIANDFGLDFERIRSALAYDYPRAADMPGPGLAAGPCLLKDTMQLAAFNNNNFTLGHASMMINEGLPLYVVARLEQRFDLSTMTVGILGMAFKGESDDIRSSLSYKLKRLLRFKAARVLCADPYVTVDPDLTPVDEVLSGSDVLIIGAPHKRYRDIATEKPVVDMWNLLGRGVLV
jgi:UDP-N-acetyl-D-mannosaminuronic acid dehydrogenase